MTSFTFEHRGEDLPDRAFVAVDGRYSVALIRTPEGLIIDVCPTGWDFPVDTFTVWDDEVAALESQDD